MNPFMRSLAIVTNSFLFECPIDFQSTTTTLGRFLSEALGHVVVCCNALLLYGLHFRGRRPTNPGERSTRRYNTGKVTSFHFGIRETDQVRICLPDPGKDRRTYRQRVLISRILSANPFILSCPNASPAKSLEAHALLFRTLLLRYVRFVEYLGEQSNFT